MHDSHELDHDYNYYPLTRFRLENFAWGEVDGEGHYACRRVALFRYYVKNEVSNKINI